MRLPATLSKLDDRILGNRLKGGGTARPEADRDLDRDGVPDDRERPPARKRSASAGARGVLEVVYRISRLVFLLLALVMIIGIGFTLAPTNPENSIVREVLELAEKAAGPMKDVFTQADPERQRIVNYGFAAVVYFVFATLVRKLPLPGGGKK